MRRIAPLLLAAALVLCSSPVNAAGDPPDIRLGGEAVPGRLIVGLAPGRGPDEIRRPLAEAHGRVARTIPELDAVVVDVPPAGEATAASALAAHGVRYVESDLVFHAFAVPNDPYYAGGYATSHNGTQNQWGLPRINAPAAWDSTSTLTTRATVAVVDTGIDYGHPDLAAHVVSDPSNATPCHCLGIDLVNGDADPRDDNGHGTHVSGIAAAATNNARGVAGVGWDAVRIAPVKVLNADGAGDIATIARGIMWAADHRADVISMSLGGSGYSQILQDAVSYAWSGTSTLTGTLNHSLLVAAAGNDGLRLVDYPAGLNHVLGVAATDPSDAPASFSNSGRAVALAAPGTAILSTLPTYTTTIISEGYRTSYDALDGTSMATPFVSGAAALTIAARTAAGLTTSNSYLWRRIERAAQHTTSSGAWSPTVGFGRIDLARTVAGTAKSATVGGLTGQVVSASDGRTPRKGAVVTVNGVSSTTGADGMYRLEGLPSGTAYIAVSYSGTVRTYTATVVLGCDHVSTGGAPDVLKI